MRYILLPISLIFMWTGCRPAPPPAEAASPPAQAVPEDWPSSFNIGRHATAEEITAWDIDVRPDGKGLPPGSGTVDEGAVLYAQQCGFCHGPAGEGGPNDKLVGRIEGDAFPFGDDLAAWRHRAVGSYWPYATTLFDYIRRAMPFTAPGTLSDDEVYALTAHLLHLNGIIPEDAVMNAETLPQVAMPARDRFVPDDRLDYNEVH